MAASSGDRLAIGDVADALLCYLAPLVTLVTPNLAEAALLADAPIPTTIAGMHKLAEQLHRRGFKSVLVTGGHLEGATADDVLFDGTSHRSFSAPRVATRNTHGTGCTFSAAIAAHLARGLALIPSIEAAKDYVSGALARAGELDVGRGPGPLHQLHRFGRIFGRSRGRSCGRPIGGCTMLKEFRDFAMRGNVVDLAVAVIIGVAFGKIVDSLVNDIIMPIIGAATGGLDFSNHFLPLSAAVTSPVLSEARKQGAVLAWGNFLTIVLNFLIVAFVLFLVVRSIAMFRTKVLREEQEEKAVAPPPRQEVLLEQIRDFLARR